LADTCGRRLADRSSCIRWVRGRPGHSVQVEPAVDENAPLEVHPVAARTIQPIKIDRELVVDPGQDPASHTIITAVRPLAHGLEMAVVSEGVRTAQQILNAMSTALRVRESHRARPDRDSVSP
jgi:hypothetical protein